MEKMELICREALLAEYDRLHEGAPGKARELIMQAPTIEQKRGRWIKRDAWMPGSELETKYFPFQDCSECGWSYRIKILSEFKFCPHCGADMREGSETDG